ncbi:MAG TPA: hypothetical protein VM287_08765 [Egibacteraceae bacterium]|nr:hypothetical protein [Egibacteraceae bacterium]
MERPGRAPGWLRPTPATPLTGAERFDGVDATVADFWRWAFSDLRENTTRGILAEFLVARAVGAAATLRKSWDNFDVLTPSGVRVEVKSSGYLQSWPQAQVSRIGFGKLAGLSWDENTGAFGEQREVRADVFVFAVQTCTDHAAYDALDVAQWEFYVVPAAAIRGAGYRSASVGFVREHANAGPIGFGELAAAIEDAGATRAPSANDDR